jgi:hypothetical protein
MGLFELSVVPSATPEKLIFPTGKERELSDKLLHIATQAICHDDTDAMGIFRGVQTGNSGNDISGRLLGIAADILPDGNPKLHVGMFDSKG